MVTDPISDLLIRIKNGYLAGKTEVVLPWSKLKATLSQVLMDTGYLDSVKVVGESKKEIVLTLKYKGKVPALTDVRRISRPSLRVYVNRANLPRVLGGLGTAIISTPLGLLTDKEARKKNVGGEVICELW